MPTILFLCPHGAAKSVLAAAYCRHRIQQQGLDWQVLSAGTEPDETISRPVAEWLMSNGLPGADHTPRRVTQADVTSADRVNSLGCDRDDLPASPHAWATWEVPLPSQDLPGAWQAICRKVDELIDEQRAA